MENLIPDKICADQMSLERSNCVWNVVVKWDWLPEKTMGSQWVESSDSIFVNIAGDFGEYSYVIAI
jgi:hypothetical protein